MQKLRATRENVPEINMRRNEQQVNTPSLLERTPTTVLLSSTRILFRDNRGESFNRSRRAARGEDCEMGRGWSASRLVDWTVGHPDSRVQSETFWMTSN